jgi:hypothetical protein
MMGCHARGIALTNAPQSRTKAVTRADGLAGVGEQGPMTATSALKGY